ncbi:acyltransferase [Streptomyces sp. AK02-04a]|uniref:acyltransferase family protein n=1 Tax=Streptomyces sp. AK02-04a TaxID=3028649 RepID=UPI0029AD4A2D|nr:acyltransferase [Streptomyces sp. AK02-04a]MDX3763393.1 acyltransferase [Streptomyces sp. AK02-04a]
MKRGTALASTPLTELGWAPDRFTRDAFADPRGNSRIPSIDGLRALAVLGVVVFHFELGLPGGFLGVDLFFVISGFVITRLLLAQRERNQRRPWLDFWFRRAKRLLPAVLLVVAAVQAWMLIQNPPGLRPTVNGQTRAALTYVSNWYEITAHIGYWAVGTETAPLSHLWSLAVEEQFYMLWPLVLAAALALPAKAPRRALAAAIALAAVSYTLAHHWYDPGAPDRAYLGTDARAGALLLGAVVALRPVRLPAPLAALLTAVSVVVLGALWATADIDSAALYTWQLPVAGLAAAVVVNALAHTPTGALSRLLCSAPLQWVGLRSYPIYLWHWPVWIFLGIECPALSHYARAAGGFIVALVLAAVSYALVEQPVRACSLRPLVILPALIVCSALLAGAALLPVTAPVDAESGVVVTGPNAP